MKAGWGRPFSTRRRTAPNAIAYPAGPTPDVLVKHSFDTLLELMRETHANWLARVAVEGCEQQRAEEIGELAVDLAIVPLQLAAPYLDTRSMCRLDSRRGSAQKRVISEANGHYNGSWSRKEPGMSMTTLMIQADEGEIDEDGCCQKNSRMHVELSPQRMHISTLLISQHRFPRTAARSCKNSHH